MPRTYADLDTLILNKLADTAGATFVSAKRAYQIEESLKEISVSDPHLVYIAFKIESRYGTASSTSANNLVDTTKGQFVSTDPADEKVVYNATDKTWATITSYASTASVGLSADIFTVNDAYRIFNKRCVNKRQIYIGDVPERLKAIRAEYPTNDSPRNWRNIRLEHGGEVLELKVESVGDSNSTLSPPGDTEVIVEFSKTHVLNQLTDLGAVVANTAGYAAAATSMAVSGLQSAGVVEEGDEFHIENHRSLYMVVADVTASTAGAATLGFYPGLEAAVVNNDVITFIGSSLKPQYEEILADLVAGLLMENESPKHIGSFSAAGVNTWRDYLEAGGRKVRDARAQLRKASVWNTYRSYPTE